MSAQFVHITTQLRMAWMHRSRCTGQLRSPRLCRQLELLQLHAYLQRSCLGAVRDPKQPQSGHHQDRRGTSSGHTVPTQNGAHTFSMHVCQSHRHVIGTLTTPKSATTRLPHGPTTAANSLWIPETPSNLANTASRVSHTNTRRSAAAGPEWLRVEPPIVISKR